MAGWRGRRTHKGGVLERASMGVSCSKVPGMVGPHPSIDACACLLVPYHTVCEVVRLSGVCVSPSVEATPQMMEALTDPKNQSTDSRGYISSHPLVGDFYQHSWKRKNDELFLDWMEDAGKWELSGPNLPRRKKGSTLGTFRLLPGASIPEGRLPLEMTERGGVEADFDSGERGLDVFPFYRSRAYNFPVIADHHPAVLYFHSGKEIPRIPIKTPRASQPSKEDWIE